MSKKLYTVEIETTLVVVAASEAEAEAIARRVVRVDDGADVGAMASEMTRLPPDWDKECVPFGPAEGRTIGQWIEASAASDPKKD
jgi:hypothetical protein